MINIYNPNICNYSESAINAIKSGWISNHGEYVKKSTDKFKEYLNVKHIILMANGTCATHALFLALKYKYPNINKIYVSNNCYVAAWNALIMEYNETIIDVMKMDIDTWNINTEENYIKSLDIGAAVLIVHNLGNIVNVPRLKKIRPDLIFIEDNCEGLFGIYDGVKSGTSDSSLCSSVSFYGNKIITTGEGGAFMTNDTDVYNYILKAYSQGLSATRYLHDTHAYNYRMTNVQAAFLYDQSNDVDNILANKKKIFDNYEKLLEPLITTNRIKLFKKEDNTENSNWIFSLRIVDNFLSIDETFDFFKNKGIDTRPFFYPINHHNHLKNIKFNDNVSYKLNSEIIMIPSSPDIKYEEQEYIVDSINQFIIYMDTKYTNINNNLNVLIFPSGSGVSKEIFDALKYIRWINIYGMESDEQNFSYYQFKNIILGAPFIKDIDETLNFLKHYIKEYNIHCIFPSMDNVILFLKKYESELNVKIISSDLETCEICLSKTKTYNLFKEIITTPKIYNEKEIDKFPLFIKPECGYGSRDSLKINNMNEYLFYSNKRNDLIICEYLPGEEYTVDCFTSKTNGLLFCSARTRSKTLNGMSILTKTINIPEIKVIANKISEKLNFIGAWFFQIKKNINNQYTLLEIAPRIPGAMSLHRNMGINFPLLSIYEHFDFPVNELLVNKYEISCYKYFENRYKLSIDYDVVYIDLDDTIIIKNKVNTKIIQYLYYLKNINKQIILITKNKNPVNLLNNYNISTTLFDNIIKCNKNEKKIDYINKNSKCIFIDDSYVERKQVFDNNIYVFNCDMIECLLDEKL